MADLFQPKFVDLVRNTTITTGTANFALGAAIAGYTSFTAACQVGDTFYYSAIGIDKPTEREVGRGTLLAGGTISRDPIVGAKTAFTAGAKSVSLIAASEWYQSAQQLMTAVSAYGQSLASAPTAAAARATLGIGSAATELVSRFAVTLSDRSSLAGYSASSTAFLREAGREGVFTWEASNLSANVAADSAQGIYVAGASDATGAAGAWVRKIDTSVDPRWWGVADGAGRGAANDAALAAMFVALRSKAVNGSTFYQGIIPIRFPAGYFEFSSTIELSDGTFVLEGCDTGFPAGHGTMLKFPAGITAIRVQRYNTSGAIAVRGAAKGGDGSVVRNITLSGAYAGTEAEAHGIHLRARAHIENVFIDNFQGDGIYAVAVAGTGAPTEGNANNVRVLYARIQNCRNGIYMAGGDANIWTIIGVDCSGSRRWNFWDSSFLGNSYFGCHADAGGISNGTPATIVSHAGNRYCVKRDQGPAAATNAPSGTTADNGWWYYFGPGGANSAFNIPAWTSGGSYRDGGSYRSDGGGNAGNLFAGCYHEGGQGFAQIEAPALVEGGSMRPNVRGVACTYGGGGGYGGLGYLASSGGLIAAGNLSARGSQHDFGPISGSAEDNSFNLYATNVESGFWFYRAGGGTLDGYFRMVAGTYYLNGTSGGYFRAGGANIAAIAGGGIDLQAGKVLSVAGVQVVGPRSSGTPGDATDLASALSLLNSLKAKLVAHGLIA